jgi:hypothetical protein
MTGIDICVYRCALTADGCAITVRSTARIVPG